MGYVSSPHLVVAITLSALLWVGVFMILFMSFSNVHTHCNVIEDHHRSLPSVYHVRALSDHPPTRNDIWIDGVLMKHKDRVFVWTRDIISHRPSVWILGRKGKWSRIDIYDKVAVGSYIQVLEGLKYSGSSFIVKSNDHIIPLWQHMLAVKTELTAPLTQGKYDGNIALLKSDQQESQSTDVTILPR